MRVRVTGKKREGGKEDGKLKKRSKGEERS